MSAHTSIKARVDHCAANGTLDTLLRNRSRYSSQVNVETGHWLFPIEDRRDSNGLGLAGMLRGMPLSGYLQLVDWSSRMLRPGKVNLTTAVPDILTRLQVTPDGWLQTLGKLLGPNKKLGSYFGGKDRLSEAATLRGCKFVKSILGGEADLIVPSAG